MQHTARTCSIHAGAILSAACIPKRATGTGHAAIYYNTAAIQMQGATQAAVVVVVVCQAV
jgi:hypothetical protein